jgi:putative inorganic carbon (HCO3(-)) transporter
MSAVSEQVITPQPSRWRGQPPQRQSRLVLGELPVAFAALWLFTLLLYVRPNEVFPSLFGDFPLIKIVAIFALLSYFLGKHARGEALTIWPIELRMVLLIWGLGALLMPLAASPGDSWKLLTDIYLKVVCIFFLLINLLDARARLRSVMKLVVVWGTVLASDAIYSFASGRFTNNERRIQGLVSGIFGNPNDLAIALNLLLPLSVALALNNRGWKRFFYAACAALLGMGVIATFSRGGFLGLLACTAVLLWRIGRSKRAATAIGAVLVAGSFLMFMPTDYGDRISTILASDQDKTGSSQERRELLKRAASLAVTHPVIGVGIGNFHIYSIKEKLAHNAYLEIAAELGLAGLLAYLALILAPLRSMWRVEREALTALHADNAADAAARARLRESYYLSIALQAALAAYIVCTLFGSVQYQWFLYYIAAYAIAVRRIYAAEHVDAPSAETLTEAGPVLPPHWQVRPRTRLGRLGQVTGRAGM